MTFVRDPDGNIGTTTHDMNSAPIMLPVRSITVHYGVDKPEMVWNRHNLEIVLDDEVLSMLANQPLPEEPTPKPTPTPWRAGIRHDDVWIDVPAGLNGEYPIAELSGPDAEANAELITRLANTEGELVEVLNEVSTWAGKDAINEVTPLENWDLWHKVETVLAKAEGRKPDYSFHDCTREEIVKHMNGEGS